MSNLVVGLDIGQHSIKLIRLQVGLRSWEVQDWFEEPCLVDPPGTDLAAAPSESAEAEVEASPPSVEEDADPDALPSVQVDALRRLADRGLLEADSVWVAAPFAWTYLTPLALPFRQRKDIESLLLPQLDDKLPEDVEDLLLDGFAGGPLKEGGFRIHSAAIRPERVASLIGTLESMGATLRGIDVSPYPLAQVLQLVPGAEPGVATALLDIGAEQSSIVICRDGMVEYVRALPGGSEALTRALATEFQLSSSVARDGKHAEGFVDPSIGEGPIDRSSRDGAIAHACREALMPLLRRLRASLHAHATQSGTPVQTIWISGGGSLLPGLDGWLSQLLGVDVQRWSVQRPEWQKHPAFAEEAPRWAMALGLALRGTPSARGSDFNLRRGPFAFRGSWEFLQSRIPHLLAAAAALALAVGVWGVGQRTLLRAEQARLDSALATLTEQAFGEVVSQPRAIRSRLQAVREGLRLHPERNAFWYFVEVANAVAWLQDNGARLEARTIDVDLGRFVFTLEGLADSAQTVDSLQTELGGVACLNDIARNDLSARPDGGFSFRLQGRVGCDSDAPETGGRGGR